MQVVKPLERMEKTLFSEYKRNKGDFIQYLNWKDSQRQREHRIICKSNVWRKYSRTKLKWVEKMIRPKVKLKNKTLIWTFRGLRWVAEEVIYNENSDALDKDNNKDIDINVQALNARIEILEKKIQLLAEASTKVDNKKWKDEAMDIKRIMNRKQNSIIKIMEKGKEKTDEDEQKVNVILTDSDLEEPVYSKSDRSKNKKIIMKEEKQSVEDREISIDISPIKKLPESRKQKKKARREKAREKRQQQASKLEEDEDDYGDQNVSVDLTREKKRIKALKKADEEGKMRDDIKVIDMAEFSASEEEIVPDVSEVEAKNLYEDEIVRLKKIRVVDAKAKKLAKLREEAEYFANKLDERQKKKNLEDATTVAGRDKSKK